MQIYDINPMIKFLSYNEIDTEEYRSSWEKHKVVLLELLDKAIEEGAHSPWYLFRLTRTISAHDKAVRTLVLWATSIRQSLIRMREDMLRMNREEGIIG